MPIKMYALVIHQLSGEEEERVIEPNSSVCARQPHQLTGARGERVLDRQSSGCAHHHRPATRGVERVIVPIKVMRSPHTSYRWRRRERPFRGHQVYVLTTQQPTGGEERENKEPIQVVCAHHHHTSYRLRGESHRCHIHVSVLTTHQLQVEEERDIEPIKCMRSPHTSYR